MEMGCESSEELVFVGHEEKIDPAVGPCCNRLDLQKDRYGDDIWDYYGTKFRSVCRCV